MNCSNARISLDINKNGSGAVVYAKRGDVGRRIYIVLTDGCIPYHIAGDCTAVFTAKKPDNNVLYNDCSIQGDTIIYDMTEQTTSVVGRLMCEVKLYGGDGKLLTSPKFTLIVSATVYDEGDKVESTREFSALTAAMTELAELKKKGLKGDEGDSAYEVAKTTGFEGTEEEWLKSLVGPKGDKGEKGEKGEAADAVQYVAQPLTEKQQMQARQNMGLYGSFTKVVSWDGDATGKVMAGSFVRISDVPADNILSVSGVVGTMTMDGEEYPVSINEQNTGAYRLTYGENTVLGYVAIEHDMDVEGMGAAAPEPGLYVNSYTKAFALTFTEKEVIKVPKKYLPDDLGAVKTVNGVGPDANGNVEVKAGTPTDKQIATAVKDYMAENPVEVTGVVKSVNGETPDGSGNVQIPITKGSDGGYYTPTVTQVDENTMEVSFAASKEGMADVARQKITLPAGKEGNGIASAVLNADYTLTLTFDDGTSYTTPSIRGANGEVGKNGSNGVGIASIKQTTTSTEDGGNNVFTVTLTNGTTATFTVKNGSKGSNGTSVSVKSVSESTVDGGSNVVTFTDGTTVTVKNGKNGADGYTPVKGTDYFTEADKVEIVQRVIESLGGNPIFGIVDENNNIVVSGNLPDGTYSVKYEMDDGKTVNIGNLVLDSNVYYTVKNTLINCTSSNSATEVIGGKSYSAAISAKSGYELSSVKVTMGGTDISSTAVSGGKITIPNVTGNIVITATATEIVVTPTYTNLFDPSKATINQRYNSSGALTAQDGYVAINIDGIGGYTPFTADTKIYMKGASFNDGDGKARISTFKTSGEDTSSANRVSSKNYNTMTFIDEGNGVESVSGVSDAFVSGVVRMAICPKVSSSAITANDIANIIITIGEPIG